MLSIAGELTDCHWIAVRLSQHGVSVTSMGTGHEFLSGAPVDFLPGESVVPPFSDLFLPTASKTTGNNKLE